MFLNCGFNSAGLMFSGGCSEQLATWILNGQADLHMYNFDIRYVQEPHLQNMYHIEILNTTKDT